MRREHFVSEPARENLRMENDLLKYELIYLRQRVEALQVQLTAKPDPVPPEVLERHALAEKDLLWMLHRIDRSPVGWLVRRRGGFRNLWKRWIEDAE